MEINEDATNFLKYAYSETKDLSKHFLTVLTAVLVFSLAFAEKVVDIKNADIISKGCLGAAWCSFFTAIVSCGVAICYVALSGGAASANRGREAYWTPMRSAIKWLTASGALFTIGLMALIVTTIRSIFRT